jgi:hypothetical protein
VAAGDRGLTGDPEREGRFRENVPVELELGRSMGYRKMKVLVGQALAGVAREEQLALALRNVGYAGRQGPNGRQGLHRHEHSGPASCLNKGRLNELVPDIKRISAAFSEALGSF